MVSTIQGWEPTETSVRHTQVYEATHDGEGKRLPLYERSFVSFTFGGKSIEDFNFLSVINADRMTGEVYAKFNDNTSTYDVIDGQFYWGSHFTNNELQLKLATDRLTERELNDFKNLFAPGPAKELVLAEHPNRAIMARVSQPPKYNLLPFGEEIIKNVRGNTIRAMTTIYKGEIDLTLTMDDPFWYSIYNVLPSTTMGASSYDNIKTTLDPVERARVVVEDNVPTQDMVPPNTITGNDALLAKTKLFVDNVPTGQTGKVAEIGDILPTVVTVTISSNSEDAYLFYAGTAPAPTILSFSLAPQLQDGYISYPQNSIYNKVQDTPDRSDYNTITVGSQVFKFSTPGIYTGYNQALQLVANDDLVKNGTSVIDLSILLHEKITEHYSRAWALACVNYLQHNSTLVNQATLTIINKESFFSTFKLFMESFLGYKEKEISVGNVTGITNDGNPPSEVTINTAILNDDDSTQITITSFILDDVTYTPNKAHFSFNSKLGVAEGTFTVNYFEDPSIEFTSYSGLNDFLSHASSTTVTENVGDMVYEKYLYLEDRNYIDIDNWEVVDRSQVTTNYPTELEDFDIQYKHMYL